MDNMEQDHISHIEESQTTEPTGKNGAEPKTFTQEDIDRIVQTVWHGRGKNISPMNQIL